MDASCKQSLGPPGHDGGPSPYLRVERLGRVPYGPMHALQLARQAEVAEGRRDETLFLLEHPPVLTIGRNGRAEHVLIGPAERARRGIEYFTTGRGGDVTYHGPGQLVAYPIVRLRAKEQDLRHFVTQLEEIVIRTAADFGVAAHRSAGMRGVWVGNDKLAAIGVRMARWTSCHGLALNVNCDLADFATIIPCGLHGRGVTSLARLTGAMLRMAQVEDRLVRHTAAVLGRRARSATASPLPEAPGVAPGESPLPRPPDGLPAPLAPPPAATPSWGQEASR